MANQSEHHHHHGPWGMEQLKRLEHPDRARVMPPEVVLAHLNAGAGSRVADVGAGLGWLTFPLAVAVGASGRVLAIDPSEDGVAAIRERAKREGLGQIEALVAAAEDTGLADETVDSVVWHTMYHDVADRPAALGEMRRILKPGGRWVIVDWIKEEMESGPPLQVRMSAEEVEAEVTRAGFAVVDTWSGGPVTWGLTVEKR